MHLVAKKEALKLPFRIEDGSFNLESERLYNEPSRTYYQKKMRQHTTGVLLDHITKPLTALEEERVKRIPPGGDWRDLPNEKVLLPDGRYLPELVYNYKNHHYKKNKFGKDRGVCPCMEKEGADCMESCVQKETLIPYFLVHSGARNNEYAGLCGRVEKDGVFPTVTTDPRPLGKQGRVLHPDQDRVCSVREFARAQGFPDHYKFCGTLAEKYRQVMAVKYAH